MEKMMARKTYKDTPPEYQKPLTEAQKVRLHKRSKSLSIYGLYFKWKAYESALHKVGPVNGPDGQRAAPLFHRNHKTWGKTVFLREMWLEKVRVLVPPTEEEFAAWTAALAAEEDTRRIYAQYSAWNAWREERADAGEETLARAKRASVAVGEELSRRSGRFRQSWKQMLHRERLAAAGTGGQAPALETVGGSDD
jgi:hypothetical protein